ncbi:MAG TPA: methyl-accepting chemotaxis protein [Gammaproteobacteria bacterium]|nr:methyl-accepting chemotaxis protein [Gammaproteobacteria bacterium]
MSTNTIKTSRNKLVVLLVIVASIAIAAAVADIVISAFTSTFDGEFRGYAAEQAVNSQSIAADTDLAIAGDRDAFQRLLHARQQFDHNLFMMLSGDSATFMPAAKGAALKQVELINGTWKGARDSVQKILDERDAILLANQIETSVDSGMPDLLAQWDQITKDLVQSSTATQRQIYLAGRQSVLGQRLINETNVLVGGAGDVAGAAQRLEPDLKRFIGVGQGLMVGDPALNISPVGVETIRPEIAHANASVASLKQNLQALTSLADDMVAAHKAAKQIDAASADLLGYVSKLQDVYERQVEARPFQPEYGYIIGGIALVILLITLYIYLLNGDARKAAAMQQRQTERNQEAILRLLDELGSLADGDLTVEVTVTEDITGAIADSINFALEALRDLVRTINDTSVQVDAAARGTRSTAADLAEASAHQSRQIATAGGQISDMAHSIEQVSANAERSTQVARQSVAIAHNGGQAVRRTIEGMNAIRETIQETSKRIKRLGESSQEIGDIVELINDIAEQTNILALNAAIQASMAGEAGRGFAVVADEVQRLAERSANATRQIEALVKTIQTDTNEAVMSMEESTSGVVTTAELAENAGSALDEIENVSNNIATLIQSISNSARQQAEAAADVSKTMNSIQEITSRTSRGTSATAQAIGKLAELATQLRTSVAGFKLPGQAPDAKVEAEQRAPARQAEPKLAKASAGDAADVEAENQREEIYLAEQQA